MYCIGDKVVHPMHGAGIIKDLKKIMLGGVEREYYVVCFIVGNMISDIPVDGCEKIGIRDVISKDDAKKVLEFFHSFEVGDDLNWNKRQRENMLKLKSGDIYQVAGVLKELMCREKVKGLSTSERKTLGSASPEIYIKMAKDWLEDKDSELKGGEKLAVYHDCIIMGD